MRILVSGDRDWDDPGVIDAVLTGYFVLSITRFDEKFVVIEGGARGADEIAQNWRKYHDGVTHITVDAEWDLHGKAAGPIRNRVMVDEHYPDVVLAFHDDLEGTSRGTKDCVAYAKEQGIPVYNIRRM